MSSTRILALCAVVLLVGSCTGLKSGTCGQEGQACCSGKSCEGALICGNDDLCAVAACNTCTPNSKRCSAGGGIDVCTLVGACPDWTPLLTGCPTGSDCVAAGADATCVERCPQACTLDSLVCASTGLTKCAVDTNTSCPALFPEPDDSTAPVCLAGACDGNWCWESPAPQGTSLVAVDGWALDQFWLIDRFGNILRRDANGWTYEYRVRVGKAVRALSQCGSLQGYLIAVGDNGTVMRRTFGGVWVDETFPDSNAQLNAISCSNNYRAFAVGNSGKAFVRDQSQSGIWRVLDSQTNVTLRGAAYYYFTGDGWAVGDNGTIVRCRDLNSPVTATCMTEPSSVAAQLNAIRVNGNNGDVIAVGNGGTIVARVGGWSQVAASLTGEDLTAVGSNLDSPSIFIAVGRAGGIYKGAGGNNVTWSNVTPTGTAGLAAVFLADQAVVAAGENGHLWFNRSGGAKSSWNGLGGTGPLAADLHGVSGLSPDDVWAVGTTGGLFHRRQGVWSREAAGVVSGTLFAVAVADGGEVFAVGDTSGKVLVGSPGKWAAETQSTNAILLSVFADDTHAVAVGTGGAWVERPRGPGGQWSLVSTGVGESLYGVAARVQNGRTVEVNAVGDNCALVTRYADGGFNASQVPGCNGDTLFSVWAGSDGELLVGGESAFVSRRVNGVWTREYVGTTLERIYSITQSGGRSWAACESGELYVRTNGTWNQELPRFTGGAFKGAWSSAQGDVWVVGPGGMILRGR